MGFSRREYWSGLSWPPPGDLPDPGTEPVSLTSPALAGGFFTTSATWEVLLLTYSCAIQRASQEALVVKNPPANAGDPRDVGLIPG